MIVFWSMLVVALGLGALSYISPRRTVLIENRKQNRTLYIYALLLMLYVVLFAGFRDGFIDSAGYVKGFNEMSTNWGGMLKDVQSKPTGQGYYFLQGCFKILISQNHYAWFIFVALISSLCLFRVLYKYSADFILTGYLFIATATVTWLFNGARQFLAVCILFAFIDLLLSGKWWKKLIYCVIALAVATIHNTALFIIPIALLVSPKKFLSVTTVIVIIITVIGTYFSEFALGFVGDILDKDYSASLEKTAGQSVVRFLVDCVPMVLSLFARKKINSKAPPSIRLAANMSVVAACFSFASVFTSGVLVGRMTMFFSIYSLYLYPWLIKNMFKGSDRTLMWWLCVGFYLIYFYYQMEIAWGAISYVSHILGIG